MSGLCAKLRRSLPEGSIFASDRRLISHATGTPPVADDSGDDSMNWDQIQGKWKQLRGSVKVRWAKLTDSDVELINGRRDRKEQAEKQVNDWAVSLQEEPAGTRQRKAG